MLVPSNMIFFIEEEEKTNNGVEWAGGKIMHRINKKGLQAVIKFLNDDISKTRHIFTLDNF
jgi:hypothetical protein